MNTDYCVACFKAQGESTGGQKDCRQCMWYEKPAPKKLSDHLPGCAALTTHDKDCDCSPAPDDGGRKP